jgi:hypothetical protein
VAQSGTFPLRYGVFADPGNEVATPIANGTAGANICGPIAAKAPGLKCPNGEIEELRRVHFHQKSVCVLLV